MGGFGPRTQTETRPGAEMRTGLGLGTNTKEGSWADSVTGDSQDKDRKWNRDRDID